jgi:cytochrome c oxidase subunit 3
MSPRPPLGVVVYPRPDGPAAVQGAGRLGMRLFLLSLGVLFVAGLVAFWVVWSRAPFWPPAGAPPLPRTLLASTALALGTSVAAQGALGAIRRGNEPGLARRLDLALALALGFVLCQAIAWVSFFDRSTFESHLYGFTFYALTGLHGLHVLGGIVGLAVVTVRARLGKYSWANHAAVRSTAGYWHFLGAVWLAIYATLALAGRTTVLLG